MTLSIEDVEHVNAVRVVARKGSGVAHVIRNAPVMLGSFDVVKLCGGVLGNSGDDTVAIGNPDITGAPLCKRCDKLYAAMLEGQTQATLTEAAEPSVDPAPESKEDKDVKAHKEAVKAAKDRKAAKAAVASKEPKPVKCVPSAPANDNGDGSGVCRACSWHGPLKEDADGTMVMTAHWVGGRAPKAVTLPERKVGTDAPLSESPATTDKGNRSADDMIGGNGAGMLPGRTSLTRGSDMTGAQPRERGKHKLTGESLPTRTTLDVKLGREHIDALADTTKVVVVTKDGTVKVVSAMVGGERGYLTQEEYATLGATQRRQYWRNVKKAKDQAKAFTERRRAATSDTRSRAERMTGRKGK